jgi:hypothetical protein
MRWRGHVLRVNNDRIPNMVFNVKVKVNIQKGNQNQDGDSKLARMSHRKKEHGK